MPESSEKLISDSNRSEKVWFREPLVIIPLICLMFLCGITTTVEDAKVKDIGDPKLLSLRKLCKSVISMPAIIITAFLSNYTGRKPIIILLFLLSVIASILQAVSLQGTWLLLTFIVQDILYGGSIMSFLAICEYSSSKNKFSYLIAAVVMFEATEFYTKTVLYRGDVLGNDSLYMQVFPVVLGLVCLGSTWQLPESPHWLASKGKIEDGRKAYAWLHGGEELQSFLQEPNDPDPPLLLGLSLLTTIITISFYQIIVWYKTNVEADTDLISGEFKTAILVCSAIFVVCGLAFIMNRIKLKFIVSTVLGCSALFYIIRYFGGSIAVGPHPTLIYVCNIVTRYLSMSGSIALVVTIAVSKMPQKYKSFVYAFLSYIFLGTSAIVLLLAVMVSYNL